MSFAQISSYKIADSINTNSDKYRLRIKAEGNSRKLTKLAQKISMLTYLWYIDILPAFYISQPPVFVDENGLSPWTKRIVYLLVVGEKENYLFSQVG